VIGVFLGLAARVPLSVPTDTIHLNQVSPEQLALDLALDLTLTDRLVRERDARRGFHSIAEAARVPLFAPGSERARVLAALRGTDFNKATKKGLEAALRIPAAFAERVVSERRLRPGQAFAKAEEVLDLPVLPPHVLEVWHDRLIVRTPSRALAEYGVVLLGILLTMAASVVYWRRFLSNTDPFILPMAWLLFGIGFVIRSSLGDPLRNTLSVWRDLLGAVLGLLALTAVHTLSRWALRRARHRVSVAPFTGWFLGGAIVAWLIVSAATHRGRTIGLPSLPWLGVVLTVLFWAWLLQAFVASLSRPVLAQSSTTAGSDRWRTAVELCAPGVATLIAYVGTQAPGPALVTMLACFGLAAVRPSSRWWMLGGSMILGLGMFLILSLLMTVGRDTLIDWLEPSIRATGSSWGLQEALWAVAAGGLSGSGLGLGHPEVLQRIDGALLAAVAEDLGLVGCILTLVAVVILVWRSLRAALPTLDEGGRAQAAALVLFIAACAFLSAGGATGLTPLMDIPLPFVSGSRLLLAVFFGALGYLLAVQGQTLTRPFMGTARPFRRRLSTTLSVFSALAIGAVGGKTLYVQGFVPERIAGRYLLIAQGDSGFVKKWNPRLEILARQIPRGSIYDIQGRVLATSRFREISAAIPRDASGARRYYRAGRYYPYGEAFLPIVGIWDRVRGAVAGLEQELDTHLRGYAEVHELLRAYQGKDLPTWLRGSSPAGGDVLVSMDAAQQQTAYRLLRKYVARSGERGEGFAVVLNAIQGHPVVAVSTPMPNPNALLLSPVGTTALGETTHPQGVRDLWPAPSSLLKLAMALCVPPELRRFETRCDHFLARVEWSDRGSSYRADHVTDYPLDLPHGRIGLRRALKVSCNVYFAELAAQMGAASLYEGLDKLGIAQTVAPRDAFGAHMVDLLADREPLLLSPIGAASVLTAATARSAPVRPPMWFEMRYPDKRPSRYSEAAVGANTLPVLPDNAELVTQALREAVAEGPLSEVFSSVPWPVAGRTAVVKDRTSGTSYAWFYGFAPARQPAFVVVTGIVGARSGYDSAAPLACELLKVLAAKQ